MKNEKACDSPAGFTLLEVMISVVFILLFALSFLPCLAYLAEAFRVSGRIWAETVTSWNQTQEIRADPDEAPGVLFLAHGKVPIRRAVIESTVRQGTRRWEVLVEAK